MIAVARAELAPAVVDLPDPLDPGSSVSTDETIAPAETGSAATTAPAETGRVARVAEDQNLIREATDLLASLAADPRMAVELAQAWLRDLGTDIREGNALAAQDRAELNERLAELAEQAERTARAAAAEGNLLGQIFGWIGTGLALAVSAVTSVFTGGASLALGVAAVACMLAAQTVSVLGKEGIIDDPMVAQGISIGFAALSTAFSFGATAAGSATQAATSAASLAAQVLSRAALETAARVADAIRLCLDAATLVTGVAGGLTSIASAVQTYAADLRQIDGERHETRADVERGAVEENTDELAAIMRQARHMAQLMAEVREERAEATSAAILRV